MRLMVFSVPKAREDRLALGDLAYDLQVIGQRGYSGIIPADQEVEVRGILAAMKAAGNDTVVEIGNEDLPQIGKPVDPVDDILKRIEGLTSTQRIRLMRMLNADAEPEVKPQASDDKPDPRPAGPEYPDVDAAVALLKEKGATTATAANKHLEAAGLPKASAAQMALLLEAAKS